MLLAFILMNVKLGTERKTLEELKKISDVKEAYIVYGTFDLVAKIESRDTDSIRNVVSAVRGLGTVSSTLTMIAR